MTDQDEPGGESRTLGYDHGFSPAVGRGSEDARRAGDLAFRSPPRGPQWPGREPSEQELEGVPPTDTEARSPLGVGVSTTGRAEEIATAEPEKGRRTAGTRGRAERPNGTSTAEDTTGVAPQEPVEDESPFIPPGD